MTMAQMTIAFGEVIQPVLEVLGDPEMPPPPLLHLEMEEDLN